MSVLINNCYLHNKIFLLLLLFGLRPIIFSNFCLYCGSESDSKDKLCCLLAQVFGPLLYLCQIIHLHVSSSCIFFLTAKYNIMYEAPQTIVFGKW
jgi:hypothetical protein